MNVVLVEFNCMKTDDQIIADIVIGGGGLVGLSLGLALAKSGLEIVVVDNQDPATMRKEKFDGRVCSISYGSMRVLDGIGLWDSLQGEAEPILDIRVSDQNSSLFKGRLSAALGNLKPCSIKTFLRA